MKKRLVMIFVMTMCVFLCACGGNESTSGDNKGNGSTTSQSTEKEDTETKEDTTKVPDNMTVEEMQGYYDVEKYVGTPRYTKISSKGYNGDVIIFGEVDPNNQYNTIPFSQYEFDKNVEFAGYDKTYYCIICDNNTPDDLSDDVVAYIFTTPVEQ